MDLLTPDTAENACSVSQLLADIEAVLLDAFPKNRKLWFRGEIQKINESSGHCYLDLVDPDARGEKYPPVLKVKCWKTTWGPLKQSLADDGIVLKAGTAISMRGSVDFWKARGEVSVVVDQVDRSALLGDVAKARAALIAKLTASGALAAQQGRSVSVAPMVIGLVGSPGTEGFNDFLGQIRDTKLGVRVVVARATVQGATAEAEVAAALQALDEYGVDVICLVRGGGSRGDLAAFDSESIAIAIAGCRTAVWTGIGHTGDESVADLVAHRRFVTPTACGAGVAVVLAGYLSHLVEAARHINEAAAHHLDATTRHLGEMRRRLVLEPRLALDRAHQVLVSTSSTLLSRTRSALDLRTGELQANRRVLAVLDPKRQLARGWSITTTSEGHIIRSRNEVPVGSTILTRIADGHLESTVSSTQEGER